MSRNTAITQHGHMPRVAGACPATSLTPVSLHVAPAYPTQDLEAHSWLNQNRSFAGKREPRAVIT